MEKSALLSLTRSFSSIEAREVRKFLQSPFFNQRQDVLLLFEHLASGGETTKDSAWGKVFGKDTPFEEQKLRLLMSYLHGLLEQYLAVKELISNPLGPQIQLATAYRKRKMPAAFERVRKNLDKAIEAQHLRNAEYHGWLYLLDWESHQVTYPENPTDVSLLRSAGKSIDTVFLSKKLQIVCLLAAHQTVYKSDTEEGWEAELVERAEQGEFARLPAVAVYLHCYRMLRNPSDEIHFQRFKTILLYDGDRFSAEELHGLFILAINYCVRRLNAGDAHYYGEALDLYKYGLSKNHLLEEGVLSRFTYHNIVAIGLHVGALDWVRYFINVYKNRLERRYRESVFSFNLARLAYAERKHHHVLELLQKANYRDPLHNLAAKTLLLKTYFDLGELDSLQSHLDAMRNYIQRKRVLGYHRNNYLNIIRYAEKLLRHTPHNRAATAALR
ncbi:MAG: hypothetical protein H7246_05485, partial [Phycisphaerae bacterium]|nr:hypothetical protein [Saprospiraceae bacterium]